jgi:hypothetical protein
MREGLSAETEELLRHVRAQQRMPDTHKRRLRGAVLARIAAAGTATLVAGQAMGIVAKTVLGIAIVGSLGTGGYLALRPTPVAVPAPARATASRAVVVPEATAPPAVESARPTSVPRKRAVERKVAATPSSTLADETALLRQADRALRAGDRSAALASLDDHAARFPAGALAMERTALRLVVSCELGVAQQGTVASYLAEHPGSPLAARVRRACSAGSK